MALTLASISMASEEELSQIYIMVTVTWTLNLLVGLVTTSIQEGDCLVMVNYEDLNYSIGLQKHSINVIGVQGAKTPNHANDSFFSCGKSVGTNGGGLASKISMAISKLIWSLTNNPLN
jgi:hypothetical protein